VGQDWISGQGSFGLAYWDNELKLLTKKLGHAGVVLGALFFCLFGQSALGEVVKGIYGIPSVESLNPVNYEDHLREAGINGVFLPPDEASVRWFKSRGYRIYVSVNAFGGKRAWKEFPDSRPVKADGSFLGSEVGYKGYGGVCPTHEGWREARLHHIKHLLKQLEGIDGVWLDFIRYPGRWEMPRPKIPDTCYCPRCLAKFERESDVSLPPGLDTGGCAAWIKSHCAYKWMEWKKEQIASFVSEVREIVEETSENAPIKLGLFLVPWTKGERKNAICYLLGQDPFQLSSMVDVISPMVYHRMCGRSPHWVGYVTGYYKETAGCEVWPIVESAWGKEHGGKGLEGKKVRGLEGKRGKAQSGKREAHGGKGLKQRAERGGQGGEFGEVMRFAGQGGADGVLVYSFKGIRPEMWSEMGEFRKLENSIPYPKTLEAQETHRLEPIEVKTETDEEAEWSVLLPACEPGAEYVFRADFFREGWRNGVYPSVSFWGEEYLVNTHLKAKVFQPIRVNVACPEEISDPYFRFKNNNRGTAFEMVGPSLKREYRFVPEPTVPLKKGFFEGEFFPIGVYGAALDNIEAIKRLALNTVVLSGSGKRLRDQVEKCHEVGLRYVISVPRDPDRLPVFLDEISEYVRPYDLAFYANDEPGIWSFPINKADDINRLIKGRFPKCATCMAVVRPQVCGDYRWAADFFMLDQYPVPFMPMTWLSDCMGECAQRIAQSAGRREQGAESRAHSVKGLEGKKVRGLEGEKRRKAHGLRGEGGGRLAAVVQAFGGKEYEDIGWPRLPTWREMDCLAFLSVVHGSRAVFFFTYGIMGETEEGRQKLGRVVGRLNRIYPWLLIENQSGKVQVEMLSENRFDPKGRPSVHCCLKRKGGEALLIAVNTVGTGVEAAIGVRRKAQCAKSIAGSGKGLEGEGMLVWEVFSGEKYAPVEGKIRVKLGAYEAKAFRIRGPGSQG
jgi:hypothetical protein